jgi:hypothetical protein
MTNPFPTGEYEVVSTVVRIRREPRILQDNITGKLTIGTRRRVYSVVTDKNNYTWGRISEPDAAGIAEWACIKDLNRIFMKCIEPDSPAEDRITALEARVAALEKIVSK